MLARSLTRRRFLVLLAVSGVAAMFSFPLFHAVPEPDRKGRHIDWSFYKRPMAR